VDAVKRATSARLGMMVFPATRVPKGMLEKWAPMGMMVLQVLQVLQELQVPLAYTAILVRKELRGASDLQAPQAVAEEVVSPAETVVLAVSLLPLAMQWVLQLVKDSVRVPAAVERVVEVVSVLLLVML